MPFEYTIRPGTSGRGQPFTTADITVAEDHLRRIAHCAPGGCACLTIKVSKAIVSGLRCPIENMLDYLQDFPDSRKAKESLIGNPAA